MLLSSDTPSAITKSTGLGLRGFADAFDELKPDLVLLLGDRYELLAAASAALFARITIGHIHGFEELEEISITENHQLSLSSQWEVDLWGKMSSNNLSIDKDLEYNKMILIFLNSQSSLKL